ncbi:hypothetical protein LSAT2_029996, partial [Lamellibrachia satsuma]
LRRQRASNVLGEPAEIVPSLPIQLHLFFHSSLAGALLKPSFWEQPRGKQIHSDEDYWLLPDHGFPEDFAVDVKVVSGISGPIEVTSNTKV